MSSWIFGRVGPGHSSPVNLGYRAVLFWSRIGPFRLGSFSVLVSTQFKEWSVLD